MVAEARNFPVHHRVALSKLPGLALQQRPTRSGRSTTRKTTRDGLAATMGGVPVRDHHVFEGKLDPAGLGFGERIAVKMVGAAHGDYRAPYGDYRDWDDIRSWARGSRVNSVPQAPIALSPDNDPAATQR